jgi:hypothetical protein
METNNFSETPYVGLQPYRVEDQKYFFGRERDSRIISSNLFASALTVLYGSSGVGKSSVLQAGVIPVLRNSPRTVVIYFQRWPEKDPIQILKAECLDAINTAGYGDVQVDVSLPFDEFLFQATQTFRGIIIILLDQFEEYFLYHQEMENTFDAEFARAINREEVDAHFLIALREDALAMLDRFRTRIPNLLGNSLRLRHLDAKSARDAICKPLDVYNQESSNKPQVNIEEDLINELIQSVRTGKLLLGQGGSGGVDTRNATTESDIQIETPFLQLVLTRLWDEEIGHGSNILRLQTLNDLGGARQIVRTHLNNVMKELQPDVQEIAGNIFQYLVTPSGTKIAYSTKDLAYYAKTVQPQALGPVLEKLTQGNVRILRKVTLPGEDTRYEIYHDVLGSAILNWRENYIKDKLYADRQEDEKKYRKKQRQRLATLVFIGSIIDLLSLGLFGGLFFALNTRKLGRPYLTWMQTIGLFLSWLGVKMLGFLLSVLLGFLVGFFRSLFTGLDDILPFNLLDVASAISILAPYIGSPIIAILLYWRFRRKQDQSTSVPPSLVVTPTSS